MNKIYLFTLLFIFSSFIIGCNKENIHSNLIPKNYEIEYSTEGDLNRDTLDDLVLVIKKKKEPNRTREIMVFLKDSTGYKLNTSSKTIFPKKHLSEENDVTKFSNEEIEIKDQTLFVRFYGVNKQNNIFSSYKFENEDYTSKKQILRIANIESLSTKKNNNFIIKYDIPKGEITLENINTTEEDVATEILSVNIGGMGYSFKISNPEELISYAYERIKNRNKFLVISENGLLIRDEPNIHSNRIGQLPFNTDIEILEKTDVQFSYNQTEGYWVKIAFKNTQGRKKYGYVFDGFLKPYEEPILFREWTHLNNINLHIHEESITYQLHGQCVAFFSIKTLNKKEFELIWDYSLDCVFNPQFDEDFDLKKHPINNKPFAKYTLNGRVLKVTYYYKEWVKKYSENINSDTFPSQFIELYYSF